MSVAEGGSRRAAGHIKWFDAVKGFGFILADDGGPDILLHANVLRSFGQSSIADGTRIDVEAIPTPRGLQATAILSLVPLPDDEAHPAAGLANEHGASLDALPFVPARVKWFDKAKGFGFATVFGQSADVFLHHDVLRHGGFADLAAGEAVALRIVRGSRGLMAVQVGSWDRGASADEAAAPETTSGESGPAAAARPQAVGLARPPVSPIGAEAVATPPLIAAEQS